MSLSTLKPPVVDKSAKAGSRASASPKDSEFLLPLFDLPDADESGAGEAARTDSESLHLRSPKQEDL